jgi:hypothetical protein
MRQSISASAKGHGAPFAAHQTPHAQQRTSTPT